MAFHRTCGARFAAWVFASLLLGTTGLLAVNAQEAAERQLPVTADQWFVLYDAQSGERVGATHVVIRQDETTIVVSEQLSVQQGEGSRGYRARVRYTLKPSLAPTTAEVVTLIDGTQYMEGALEFSAGKLAITSLLKDDEGKLLEPAQTDEVDMQAEGVVVFPQGLALLAPGLLGRQMLMKDVLLAEFPAELDTVVDISPGYELTRAAPAADKSVTYLLQAGEGVPAVWSCTYGADGRLRDAVFYETRMVPGTRDEALAPIEQQ